MLDPQSLSRWSCTALVYAGPLAFRRVTKLVEIVGYLRLPASKVSELSIVHVGSEF